MLNRLSKTWPGVAVASAAKQRARDERQDVRMAAFGRGEIEVGLIGYRYLQRLLGSWNVLKRDCV